MLLHPLLLRQLRRIRLDPASDAVDGKTLHDLLQKVNQAYEEHDKDRRLLEHSQNIASGEMAALYATVRAARDLLETRVSERTEALRVSENRLRSLLSLSADWVWEQDAELRFTFFSDSMAPATGLDPGALMGHQRLADALSATDPQALADYEYSVAQRKAFHDLNYRFKHANGDTRYFRISGEPVFDEGGAFIGYRGIGRDVTQTTVAELQVQQLARFDTLTGLPNRNMFLAELEREIYRAQRQATGFALCFIDLDRFKNVNDTLGHNAGDQLLRAMGVRLRSIVRQTDLVARLGGDEFVLLIRDGAKVSEIAAIAGKMLETIREPVTIEGSLFMVTGSIGISLYPEDGSDAAALLKHADTAMYRAKDKGKNNIQFYTAELAGLAARHFELESALRLGIPRGELLLHYQPKVCIRTGRMLGIEALVRWQHPQEGMVQPNDFIALAEERGLIVALGRWVMQAACLQLRSWVDAGFDPPPVAINLSARQFASDTLIADLLDAMAQADVPANLLELELTESVLMSEPERSNEVVSELRSLGLRIAIDDFGTGYSSLSYLKRFTVQTVKIDRSFISGLTSDRDDRAITQAVIGMAHTLGLVVVAEGVETSAQLDMLGEMGCDEAQGHLTGPPMSGHEITTRLHRRSPAGAPADSGQRTAGSGTAHAMSSKEDSS